MTNLGAYRFWAQNPDFHLFPPEPGEPCWCPKSTPLMEWGDFLLDGLSRDPLPGKIFYGMGHLLNRYGEAYSAAPSDHRAETNLDNHLCLHQALITIWQKMRKMQLSAAIPELEPPRVEVLPAYRAAQPEPEEVEINGIIIGHEPGE